MSVAANGRPARIRSGLVSTQFVGKNGMDSSLNDNAGWSCAKLYCMRAPMIRVLKQVSRNSSACSQYEAPARRPLGRAEAGKVQPWKKEAGGWIQACDSGLPGIPWSLLDDATTNRHARLRYKD